MQTALTYRDKRLIEKLYALRHLTSGNSLPQKITNQQDNQLFQRLLDLSDNDDIFNWLEDKEDKYLGQMAVRIAIQNIGTLYQRLNAEKKNTLISDHYRQILGGILDYSEEDFPFDVKGNGEEFYDSNEVLKVLLNLQAACQKSSFIHTDLHKIDEREYFLSALLRLPTTVDPFLWAMENNKNVTIRLILSHLLNYFTIPRGSLVTKQAISEVQIKRKFNFPSVEITVEQLILKSEGFLVKAHVNMSPQKLQHKQDIVSPSYIWSGFDRVTDNLGNTYLTWVEDLHTGVSHFHSYREDITLAFYPAIAPDATYITFFSQPVIIEAYNITRNGNRIQLPDIILENLTWRYDLLK